MKANRFKIPDFKLTADSSPVSTNDLKLMSAMDIARFLERHGCFSHGAGAVWERANPS